MVTKEPKMEREGQRLSIEKGEAGRDEPLLNSTFCVTVVWGLFGEG